MPGKHKIIIVYISLALLLILSAFAPRFAIELPSNRTFDEAHDTGYIDWAGSVGYAPIYHRDAICGGCWDTVTQISNGSQVSGAFNRDVSSFDALVAVAPNQGYGTIIMTACSSVASYNLNDGTGSTPGYNKHYVTVPAGCRDWSLSASGGVVYLAAVDVTYVGPAILPPVISSNLNCSKPGINSWCTGALTLELTASDPQGQPVTISGDVDGVALPCTTGSTTCSVPLTTEGIGAINFRVDSATGKSASGSTTYKLDATTPQLDGSLSGSNGANGWYISGVTASASASDAVSDIASLEISTDGTTWSTYSAPVTLSDGSYTVQFRATDNAGNFSMSSPQSIKVDTVTPTINSATTGTTGLNGWYVSNTQVSATTSDAGSGLSMFEVTTDHGATWAIYTSAIVFSDGSHTIQFRASDYAGNVTTSPEQTIKVDATTPVLNSSISGAAGQNGWYVSNTQVSAAASDSESGISTLEVKTDGGTWVTYSTPVTLSDGTHTVQFRTSDNAGNTTIGLVQDIKVDTITPGLNLSVNGTAGLNSWYVSITQVSANADDPLTPSGQAGSGIASVEASQNGAAYAPYSQPILFADGANTYRFKVTDNAGNVTETPIQTLNVDTIPPIISLTETLSLGNTAYYTLEDLGSGLLIYHASIEDNAGKYQKVTWQEDLIGTKKDGQILWDGKFADGTNAEVGRDAYSIKMNVSDAAGNEAAKSAKVSVNLLETILPIPPFDPPEPRYRPPYSPPVSSTTNTGFGGTVSATPTSGITSIPVTAGGTKSESTGAVTSSPSSVGGLHAEAKATVTTQTWTQPPVSTTSNGLPGVLGVIAALTLAYESYRKKEDDKQLVTGTQLKANVSGATGSTKPITANQSIINNFESAVRSFEVNGNVGGNATPILTGAIQGSIEHSKGVSDTPTSKETGKKITDAGEAISGIASALDDPVKAAIDNAAIAQVKTEQVLSQYRVDHYDEGTLRLYPPDAANKFQDVIDEAQELQSRADDLFAQAADLKNRGLLEKAAEYETAAYEAQVKASKAHSQIEAINTWRTQAQDAAQKAQGSWEELEETSQKANKLEKAAEDAIADAARPLSKVENVLSKGSATMGGVSLIGLAMEVSGVNVLGVSGKQVSDVGTVGGAIFDAGSMAAGFVRLIQYGPKSLPAPGLLGKLGAFIAIPVGAWIAVSEGLKVRDDLQDDGKLSKTGQVAAINAIGGALTMAGGVAMLIPGGQVVGGILLAAGGVASGVAWCVDNWDTITEGWNKVATAVGNAATTVSNIWKTLTNPPIDPAPPANPTPPTNPILKPISQTVTAFNNTVNSAVNTVKNTVSNTVSTVKNTVNSTVNTVKNTVKNTVSNTVNTVKNTVNSAVNTVKNTVKNTVSNTVNTVKNTVNSAVNTVKNTVSNTVNTVKNTVKAVSQTASKAVSNATQTVSKVVNTVTQKATNTVKSIGNTISNLFKKKP
jgi:hypothetical protein